MAYMQARTGIHTTENDEVVLIEALDASPGEGSGLIVIENNIENKADLKKMADNCKEPKQFQICTTPHSQSSKFFPKVRSQKKLSPRKNLSNITGTNGLESTEISTVSLIPIATSPEQSSQVIMKHSPCTCKSVFNSSAEKKPRAKPKQTEVNNGRKWKYTSATKVQPRRPLHPELVKFTTFNKETEIKESSNTNFEEPPKVMIKGTEVLKRKNSQSSVSPKTITEITCSKQKFFGNKFQEQYQVYSNGNVNPVNCKVFVMTTSPVCRKTYNPKSNKTQEPECLTISSDEEESNSSLMSTVASTEILPGPVINKIEQRQICLPDSTTGIENENSVGGKSLHLSPYESMEEDLSENEEERAIQNLTVTLKCRSVRIGSFKVQPSPGFSIAVSVNYQELAFQVPTVADRNEMVTVSLTREEIVRVLGHFGHSLPVLYIYTTPVCGSVIRNSLRMNVQTGPFYDPGGEDETQKRITILPEFISNNQKSFFRDVFPRELLQEIDQKNANEILVRSTPHNQHLTKTLPMAVHSPILTRSQTSVLQIAYNAPKKPVEKLLTYPPPPQTGGIAITTEDLECLKAGEFLNDVIIDFYLKYLVMEKLSPVDKQRTHVFSSFFYPRLTQKTNTRGNSEDESSVTIQVRRHGQVKTWTRHVDIFEKDFIIIPINQNAHWFLAIICFPGLVPEYKSNVTDFGESPVGEMEPSPEPSPSLSPAHSPLQKSNQASNPTTPKSQYNLMMADDENPTYPRVNEELENESQMDSESPLPPRNRFGDSQECVEEPMPFNAHPDLAEHLKMKNISEAERQPCVLMFDSLAGPSRWRIVGTLREYLSIEWQTKKGTKRIFDRDTMRGFTPRVPQQTNYSDCGVYVLQYVESFFKKPLQKFSSPLPTLDDWFSEESVMQKRDELRNLILELQKTQKPGNGEHSMDSTDSVPTSTVCLQGEESEQR